MGVYVNVRGWVEGGHKELARAREVVRAEADEVYGGGWGFPERPYNGIGFVFYGAEMRESGVEGFLRQLRKIAALPPDEDGYHLVGLFLVSHEVDGMSEWQVRDGVVHIRGGVEAYRYLDA
ncbi:hypothetical protein [Actinacidiphila acididurans]|uniref:Uncharacterized protein n=1 Tax=Actinacidiphila acididurans TaxID=2784346 RepID=A0ABS2TYW9_9ACTN|nr:hypothetical protein [Actinacidiphila acididurans]MBM9508532.1 hypothetical protein [Actinacidiphila acididurans]